MPVDSVNMAEHAVQLRQSTFFLGRCQDTASIGNGNCFDEVKVPSHEQAVRHRPNSASIFAPNICLTIDDKSSHILARGAILHPSFFRIDRKPGPIHNFLKPISYFPPMSLPIDRLCYAGWELLLICRKCYVVCIS